MEKLQPENFEQIIRSSNKTLRSRYLRMFEKHDMIQYFLGRSPKGIGVVKLFDAFEKSSSVGEFLKMAGYEEDFVAEMDTHERANLDYEELKREIG